VNQNALIKSGGASTAEICSRFAVRKELRCFLRDGMQPGEYAETLLGNKQYVAGIDFIAHALPLREAVWWGCLCVQHACGRSLSPAEKNACTAAVQWVLQPIEQNRVAAESLVEASEPGSASGRLAMAVNQSGENCSSHHAAPPPVAFASAKAVAAAVKLASTKVDPVKSVDTQRLFLELGIGVAEGRFVWPEIDQRSGPKFCMREV
jgi:hypothetical protein